MPDNKQIKDGVGNLFNIRMRDMSAGGDGSIMKSVVLSSGYPVDYGTGGMFQYCAKSAEMAAGAPADSPIYAFQYPATLLALIRKIRLSAWVTATTAFAGGVATFDLFAARSFTGQYGGGLAGSLGGDSGQLRTSMGGSLASIMCATTAPLTVGTRTLDPAPLDSRTVSVPSTANAQIAGAVTLLDKQQGDHPLLLVQNEGFVIRATVPPTGTWSFSVTTEWDEVSIY